MGSVARVFVRMASAWSFYLILGRLCLQASAGKNEIFNKNALFPLQQVLVFNLFSASFPHFFLCLSGTMERFGMCSLAVRGNFAVYKRGEINKICCSSRHFFLMLFCEVCTPLKIGSSCKRYTRTSEEPPDLKTKEAQLNKTIPTPPL